MGCAVDTVPQKIKRFLVGATLCWEDKNPLSGNMDEELTYEYHTNTSSTTELLLKKHGIWDVSHVVNAKLNWEVHIELVYAIPNNREKSHHIDHHWFTFRAPIFPTTNKFRDEREKFYMFKNLEHMMVPKDNRNKGYYETTRFTATVIGV